MNSPTPNTPAKCPECLYKGSYYCPTHGQVADTTEPTQRTIVAHGTVTHYLDEPCEFCDRASNSHDEPTTEPSDYSKHENHEYEPTLCAECKAEEDASGVNEQLAKAAEHKATLTPPLAADARPWDTEHFNILETALRTQGVKKPLTQEFYESYDELDAYVARLTQEARKDERRRIRRYLEVCYEDGQQPNLAVATSYIDGLDNIDRLAELNVKGDKHGE